MIRALLIAILLLGPVAARAAVPPGKRVALLIGEGGYLHPPLNVHAVIWPVLANPVHDVGLVADKLRQDGFAVTVEIDVRRSDLEKAIAAFAVKAAGADDAVVYYAGHGFEYDRHNYLVPIDAAAEVNADSLGGVYIDLDEVAAAAGRARHANVIFMDACRNPNSFVQANGAAKPYVDDVEFKPGTPVAVIYSTARGEKAFDHGLTAPPPLDYSPFAWFVAQYVTLPRVSLGDVFTFVNAKVQESTRTLGPQAPYMLSSLTERFYFRPAGALIATPPGGGLAGTVAIARTIPSNAAHARGGPVIQGSAPARSLSTPLDISLPHLAVTDEPVLLVDVLADHSAEEIAALAEGGGPMAQYLLGYMFEFGRGVQPDPVQARLWLEQAATSRLAPAELELGYFLEQNGSGDADKARGRQLMEAAAAQGYAKAQAHLANLLMTDNVTADYPRGLDLYRSAARQNYPQALYALATLKEAGTREGLTALAAGGDMASRQWLCELAAADGNVAGDMADCLAAAKAGYAIPQARLAIIYHDGAGQPADADEARHWARLALQQPDLRPDLASQLKAFGY